MHFPNRSPSSLHSFLCFHCNSRHLEMNRPFDLLRTPCHQPDSITYLLPNCSCILESFHCNQFRRINFPHVYELGDLAQPDWLKIEAKGVLKPTLGETAAQRSLASLKPKFHGSTSLLTLMTSTSRLSEPRPNTTTLPLLLLGGTRVIPQIIQAQ
uniref:Uncharacterized protein n=1 Tax=Opuntia streptacantha TaxID=393608 RepID=A0A7C9FDG3_OPUST